MSGRNGGVDLTRMPGESDVQSINIFNEKPLHAALKQLYGGPNAQFEVRVDGFIIDVVQNDLLIEVQTGGFAPLKRKLVQLSKKYRVRLVKPIAQEKWIIKEPQEAGMAVNRRKSPKRGQVLDIFAELIRIPTLLQEPNFELEVLLTQEEEVRTFVGINAAWRRRGWRTREKRLLAVVDRQLLRSPADLVALLPKELPDPFTTRDLAASAKIAPRLAQQAAYCLRKLALIDQIGKRGNAHLYRFV